MTANLKHFKELLESTIVPQTLSESEQRILFKPLLELALSIVPAKLYRYRSCSEEQFDAFNNDAIYASTADKFNDPYDCLIKVDRKFVMDSVLNGASKEYMSYLRSLLNSGKPLPEPLALMYGEELSKIISEFLMQLTDEDLSSFEEAFADIRPRLYQDVESIVESAIKYMRQQTHVACFSETIRSVTMWSHYADSHKGFALEYDMREYMTQCDKCEKNKDCPNRIFTNLYPVIYSRKRYDATSFVDYYVGLSYGFSPILDDVSFFNKAALYKSPQWSYEKEWRLFLGRKNAHNLPCLTVNLRPTAIYYGNDISPINKKLLSNMAKEKGIKEYQMYLDVESDKYSMRFRPA